MTSEIKYFILRTDRSLQRAENFMRYPGERVALFIDGANVSATMSKLRFEIDWKKLIDYFKAESHYYTAVRSDERGDGMRSFIEYLEWCGYKVHTKPIKEYENDDGSIVVKGNMDAEIITDILLAKNLDRIILFSGDGDFCYPLSKIQQGGIKVTVVSSRATKPPVLSHELHRQADDYISFHQLKPQIEKEETIEPAG